ncbi:MAG: carbohydrate binding family 9 domain-containing protein [Gemmatimonadota bacterium]|nr:MAG: carbohydrate binding family 9 domain-containing protein [Gemmatimonadota bacterium]
MMKHAIGWLRRAAVLLIPTTVLATPARAQNGLVHPTPPPEVRAARRVGPIELDGRLDEPAWQAAPPASDLIQSQPNEGELATQRTEVRFLFDDDAIYIGARMHDDLGAEGVRTRLVRRDGSADSDELCIVFDTFHDHLGRTIFSINPSGVKGDAFGPGGASADLSWDPVWEVKTRIDSLGWTAELRIPFSQLRFPRDSLQTWGLQIERLASRLNEESQWAFWRLNESGGPSRYGHLHGLEIDATPARAELLPYVVGRFVNVRPDDPNDPFRQPHELDYRMGLDLKYLLTSNLTLTATINPDFGQVEVDPAVVNLSAFETYFPEKRPFFVEGGGLIRFGSLWCFFCSNTSSISLFYSRRIGRVPQGNGIADDAGEFADIPESTTILGAAKITGRTAGGWSVGVLDALTRREHATVMRSDSSRSSVQVEPFSNYFVGRLAKDLRQGNLQVGGMFTSVVRDLSDPALKSRLSRHAEALGMESELWWAQRTYHLLASFAVSQIAGDSSAILRAQQSSARYFQRPDRRHGGNGLFTDAYDPSLTAMRGFAGYARLSKESGDWLGEISTNIRSPGFEVNDLAFLTRADYIWMSANVLRQFTEPRGIYRSMVFIAGGQQQFNFDGDLTDRQIQGFFDIEFRNYWEIATFWIHRFDVFDDRLTRGGPVVRRPGLNFWFLEASTDSRKNLVLSTEPFYGCNFEGACDYSVNLDITFRPASNVSISLGPTFEHSESSAQYVTAVDDAIATAFYGRRYVFADLEMKSISMNTRLNVTFTPTLTLELFAQPLISSARYTNFKEFDAPRRLAKSVYGEDVGTISREGRSYTVDPDGSGPAESFTFDDPDFNFRSLRGNAVLRWEFHPGSTLYLVWTQSRSDTAPVGDMDFDRDVDALFDAHADNIFLLKVNYWLDI